MTPEERERWERIDRLVEFLAANQAELSARNAEIAEEIRQHSAHIAENRAQIAQNSAQIAQQSAQISEHSAQIAQLTDAMRELGRYVLNLAHIVERTDDRLNVVIDIVERHFGNGKKP
jgi:methyl-accepting chemotaxis protein